MNRALFLTAFNRPHYLSQALESWRKVRGLDEWAIYAQIEPSAYEADQVQAIHRAFSGHPSVKVVVNPTVYGVLHNPWVGFEHLFGSGYDFVVRTEDDLVVSADILEYFDWASDRFQNNPRVATATAFSLHDGEPDEAILSKDFSPLVWGTWEDRWDGLIGPTWDHDYSTYNDQPGNQSGWDWNLDTRVFPEHNLLTLTPLASRVHNIGVLGTHSTPGNYYTSRSFSPDHGSLDFRLLGEEVDSYVS